MQTLQIDELTEQYTAAMVEAILGQLLWEGPVVLRTPDDLSDYLMLDVQSGAQLDATWIAANVRCLQQHIQSVYSGMEEGYEAAHFDPEDIEYWYRILSHYSTWSANVTLQDQAENYIVPTLRLGKTQLFRSLENNLNQMRLSSDSVQKGLMEYTQSLQRVCDLDVLNGYIDGASVQDAWYYLVGRERTPPFAYHLRTVKVELDNEQKKINPAAWGEWRAIELATQDTVVDIRPVRVWGRTVLVWCEWSERQVDANGLVQKPWALEIKASASFLNGQWSAPVSLHRRVCENDVSNGRLTVVSLGDGDPRDDRLAVCYTNRQGLDGLAAFHEIEIHETRDALFRKVADDAPTLMQATFARFRDADSLQQKLLPRDYSTVTISSVASPIGSLTDHLFLDAVHTREQGTDSNFYEVLRVRGRCTAVRETGRVLERLSINWRASTSSPSVDVSIVDAGERELSITLTTRARPTQAHALQLGDVGKKALVHTFAIDDFKEGSIGDGIWVAQAVASLDDISLAYLLGNNADDILAGAGFSLQEKGEAVGNDRNQVVSRALYASVELRLQYPAMADGDPFDWTSTGLLNGQYATPWRTYRRGTASLELTNFPVNEPIDFRFGAVQADVYGSNQFSVLLKQSPRLYTTPSIDKNSSQGAQFLSFNDPAQALKYSRLNSTFGPLLSSRAAISVDALFSWDTQHVAEPSLPDLTIEENGPFDGCNGLYFWELFFHTPDLVGSRLSAEGRYREAQGWYAYVFNPVARAITPPDEPLPGDLEVIAAPAYWRCRPLQNTTLECSYESAAPSDPDAIGYCAPVHFKIAIFLRYVQNLIDWGDSQYRRLDYDSMVAAALNYSRALSLMGREPNAQVIRSWAPTTLEDLLSVIAEREPLKNFEQSLNLGLADVPTGMQTTPRFDLLGSGVFLPGVNERPGAVWALLKERLGNLRHNRSIDGQPLSIPLFSQPLDPLDLLRAQANAHQGTSRSPGGQVQVVPYKWQTVHSLALQGTEFLIQHEEQVRTWLDMRDRGGLEELQQGHMIELAEYSRSIHEATIAQLEATAASLRQSESMLEARALHYQQLVDEGVSRIENEVLQSYQSARYIAVGSGAFRTLGAAMDLIPNVFGTSSGGARLAAIPNAVAEGLQMAADYMRGEADEASINEQYRRRQEDWQHTLDQSHAESRVVREQLLAQEHAIAAARAALLQAEIANTQAGAVYAFYKNRSTGRELSNWVVGQLKTLIYQVYDVVAGLALCAETCWQYEMGDYKTRFVRPDVWMDTYHGLTAGYSLKLDLLRMATARIKRDEHRLQLTKSISLKTLLGDRRQSALDEGNVEFSLNEKMFNEDYPGHYCRQVKQLSLTIPALLGPYQNVCAVLIQDSSATILEPDIGAVRYLHGSAPESVPAADKLVQNLRPYQQIGLSHGLNDNGLFDVLDDGRYAPFEGTGAHAKYRLTFPRADQALQRSLLQSVTDIILTLVYQARDGGPGFAALVEDELKPSVSAMLDQPDTKPRSATRAKRIQP